MRDSAILLLHIYPKELKARSQREYAYPCSRKTIHNSQEVEVTQISNNT